MEKESGRGKKEGFGGWERDFMSRKSIHLTEKNKLRVETSTGAFMMANLHDLFTFLLLL